MSNTINIQNVMAKIAETAPEGVSVTWEYPGYVSLMLENKTEILFGDSLESDTGYTWNDFDFEGVNRFCGGFDDLGNLDAIVSEFWNQTAEVFA